MTPERLTLQGCSPTPLASYLKALGVLRLLSSGANSVTGEPADPQVRGWWEGERFHLRTSLGREDVARFFLHDYAPSPVIAPWNGGSGFYDNDNKDGFRPLNSQSVAKRFGHFSMALACASATLKIMGLHERPVGDKKAQLVAALRAHLPVPALPWLDAALVLSGDGLRFPQLLGTGGNDGRLDFTNNLMRRLVSEKKPFGLFDASSGAPSPASGGLLESSLFGAPIHALTGAAVGQFSPGGAGGPNASTGYEGGPTVNPWDYVFMLEGASTFASAATRRYQSNAISRASFPFTVAPSGSGWGGVEATDEADARAAEFWGPLWSRPSRFCEVAALFGEGRAVMNGRTASDGLEFARALASLGVSRGFSEFQRYGFFKRAGKNHYAAALGRRVAAPSAGAELVADLDHGGWLKRVRRFGRQDNQPAAVRNAVKSLEDSLFELLTPDCPHRSVNAALEAIGRLGAWLRNSAKGRDAVTPPPLLGRQWLLRADDGTPEYRIAAALAGLGLAKPSQREDSESAETSTTRRAPPMAAHFAPLTKGAGAGFEGATFFSGPWLRKRRSWASDTSPPTVVWGHGGLVANMIAVLERRLVEMSIRGLADKPLAGASYAQLPDVAAFLSDGFDDARCSGLLAGMVWAQPTWLRSRKADANTGRTPLPFAYAALKPIFSPDEALVRVKAIPREVSIPIPSRLVGQLRAGGRERTGRAIDGAVQSALARARSSGIASPYDPLQSSGGASALRSGRIGVGVRPDRLAAAMLIPVSDDGLASLLRRAYPGAIPEGSIHPTKEMQNAD